MQERLQQIVESWLPYERELFFLLNGSNSVFLDNLMWTVTGRWVWIPLYAFVLFLIFWKAPKKEALLITLILIAIVVICDQFSASFTRPFFERWRPAHHPDFGELVQLVNGHTGGRFGFISSHATNTFGLAVFLALLFRYRWVTVVLLSWALVKSYSRIYLGLHFPTDFLGGVIAGALIGAIMYWICIVLRQKLFRYPSAEKTQIFSKQDGQLFAIGSAICCLLVLIFAQPLVIVPHGSRGLDWAAYLIIVGFLVLNALVLFGVYRFVRSKK
jgi:undecaprenyl-diphosphatase